MNSVKVYRSSMMVFRVGKLYTYYYSKKDIDWMRDTLNYHKSQISFICDKPNYLRFYNLYDSFGYAKPIVSEKTNAQLCSNSFLKLYEIITEFGLINKKSISAFLNAELPGGFIFALNHYCKTNGVDLEWKTSSLMSGDKQAFLNDRYGIIDANPNNWLLAGQNGDMRNLENIMNLASKYRCDLYTQDLGVDASGQYENQEEIQIEAHIGSNLCGLLMLKPGGSFIGKHYTFFTEKSHKMLEEMSKCFKSFWIVKPLASRPINSEVYIVGSGFTGITENSKKLLISLMDEKYVPKGEYSSKLLPISYRLVLAQIAALKDFNEKYDIYCKSPIKYGKYLARIGRGAAAHWIKNTNIQPIDTTNHIRLSKIVEHCQ